MSAPRTAMLCPACHHREHDPGSCREGCDRCELHTDDAFEFVLRVEPELVEAYCAARAKDPGATGLRAHPGEPHEFKTTCLRCGEYGYLHVAVITDLEVVKIEDCAALVAQSEEKP